MSTTRTLTTEEYRGVFIEVAHPHGKASEHSDHETLYGWCGYIYLWLDRFADEKLRWSLWPAPTPLGIGDRMFLRHPSWLEDLDFHGGVTYFEKRLGAGDDHGVKIGCDYRHLYDHNDLYDVRTLLDHMRHVVDRLHERTTYLMRCGGDGRLAPEPEGTIPEGWDRWVSFAYMRESEWFQKHHTADGKLRAVRS